MPGKMLCNYKLMLQGPMRPGWVNAGSLLAIRDNVFGTFLQYNNRGLVSEWKQDNFDGLPFIETYTYDLFGRLKTSHAVDNYIGASYDVKYLYQGNRLVKQTVKLAGTSTVTNEFVNTYNNGGKSPGGKYFVPGILYIYL